MKIAVIGAGLSGLVSMKESLQHGFEVVCFEKSDVIGGLWHYRDNESITVSKKTVSLTSKHMMAFSDFPMPEDFPTFLHNKYYLQYLLSYAEKHGLKDHIKFNTNVISIEKNDDYEATGLWKITSVDQSKRETSEIFEGVFVANGRYQEIHRPRFQCQEKFGGRIFDCQTYKKASGLENRRILVIGFGHTAAETAVALASVASQVYIANRQNNQWLASRMGLLGLPHDFWTETRFFHWLFAVAPRLYVILLECLTDLKFDYQTIISCSDKKLISNKTQVVSDELPFYVSSGQVKVVPNVKRFTGRNQVQLEDDTTLDVDDIILCTGYTQGQRILKQDIGKYSLHQLMYPIWEGNGVSKEHNTLCFVGMAAPRGALAPISEMQARFHCALLTGRVELPKYEDMEKAISESAARNASLSPFQIRALPYLDDLASKLGVKPDLWSHLFRDPIFTVKSLFLAAVPYQFRLQGYGAWLGAKEAMLNSWSQVGVLERGGKISTSAAVTVLQSENIVCKFKSVKALQHPLIEKLFEPSIDRLMMITILGIFLFMVQYFL